MQRATPRVGSIVVPVDGHNVEIGTHEKLGQNAREYWPLFLRKAPTWMHDEHVINNPEQLIGREEQIQRMWARLHAGGNLSIIGPPGCGKSTMLALIAAELQKHLGPIPRALWLPLQPKIKPIDVELSLAHYLGGPKAKATGLMLLLEDQHIILLIDDLVLVAPAKC